MSDNEENEMRPIPVKSRIIKSVYFSQEDGSLKICFKNGEERPFAGVDEPAVAALCAAPSPGQHYISHIRQAFRRVA
jgi:hypothetical protein